jgi:hypothetical protein
MLNQVAWKDMGLVWYKQYICKGNSLQEYGICELSSYQVRH